MSSWIQHLALFGRRVRHLALPAAAFLAAAVPATAAHVVIDDFSGGIRGSRTVTLYPLPDTSTTPQGTFTQSGGVATMTMTGGGNGAAGVGLTYDFAATDLTSGGLNTQFFLEFTHLQRNPNPEQPTINISIQATDTSGVVGTFSTGTSSQSPFNIVLNFDCSVNPVCFTPQPNWASIRQISVLLMFPGNYTWATTTAVLDIIRATPTGGAPPSPPSPVITPAVATDCASPVSFDVAFVYPVEGFGPDDISYTGTTAPGALSAAITGGPSAYTVDVSGMTGPGTVAVRVPAGRVADTWGQGNLASNVGSSQFGAVPAFTSPAVSTFLAGTAGTFTVGASGTPAPAISRTSGTLPAGLGFSTPTISGTPSAGSGGAYALGFSASNACGSATQSHTLTVNQAPAITSAATVTFALGTPASFTVSKTGYPVPTLGVTGALPAGVTFNSTTGVLSGTAAAGSAAAYPLTITASNGIGTPATQAFTLNVGEPPAITSAAAATFTVGTPGSFTVVATGEPAPTFAVVGALPDGLGFDAITGALSGTPAAGSGRVYGLTFTASNGIGTAASQSFTLTVNEAPGITSAGAATFTAGVSGTFTVSASGHPAPTLSMTGSLPAGVAFDAASGVLSGTPAATAGGTYALEFGATNGTGTASQSFTLTVNQAPAITSPSAATFTAGASGTFTVIGTGYPAPAFAVVGTLPAGVGFDGTGGVLSGNPAAGTGGVHAFTITASNGVGSAASQDFTLTVDEAPGITSADATTFVAGTPGTFTVTAAGHPAPTFSVSGALPSGLTFDPATGVLSGTPASDAGGSHALTFSATNGIGVPATQSFTLTVNQAPAITSASAVTFTVGAAATFTVTGTGYPSPTFEIVGALPNGLAFDGASGEFSGAPAAGTGGVHGITIQASNGVGAVASQSFTLTVNEAPRFTSGTAVTFTRGAPGTFTVVAAGYPAPALGVTGTLPAGVAFDAGTGVLSGTPSALSGGIHALVFSAANGVDPSATQAFSLTVNEAPSVTSAAAATFTVGEAGSFSVTATGYPAPTFSLTGAPPAGVTLDATTGVLAGTPAAGAGGVYTVTVSAANGIGSAATQAFTLTVNEAAAITSASATTFTVGSAGSFGVTATGHPAPVLALTGTLPTGVTFEPSSGVLSGTPADGSLASYGVTLTATNGVGDPAAQSFTLTVLDAPGFTSADAATFTVGAAGSFAVTASGHPAPAYAVTGTLPAGVAFDAAAGLLSGLPAEGTGGTYALTFTAENGVGLAASQAFTLTVHEAAAITSAAASTFTINTGGSFTVASTGYPAPTLVVSGALPPGVSFAPATGVLSGVPATGSTGSFPLVVTATNGVGAPATQDFTLTVEGAKTAIALTGHAPEPSVVGQAVAVSWAVSVLPPATGTPDGTVTVSDGVDSCSANVAAGACSLVVTGAGSRTLTAAYSGSADFAASATTGVHLVERAFTQTTITAHAPEPSPVGTALVVSFAVTPVAPGGGAPGGTVTVSDGVDSCSASVAAGSCSLTLGTTGARTLTASYGGDERFVASAGTALHHVADDTGLVRQTVQWNGHFAVDLRETPMVGDFDGDGRSDIVTFTRDNPAAVGDVYVALSLGDSFEPVSQKWHDWFAISHAETVVVGDFDGDGRDDMATWLGRSTRQVYVALSLGFGMERELVWLDVAGSDPQDVIEAGDVDGDGREDLVVFERSRGKVLVALSTGTSFLAPTEWHGFFAVSLYERPRVGDVSGDGLADILTFGTDSPTAEGDVYVALSDGARFVAADGTPGGSTKWHDWFAVRPNEQVRLGDLDADGIDDLFTFLPPPWGQCYTSRSLGTGLGPSVLWREEVTPLATDVAHVGDVNGDGKADVVVFAQGEGKVFVSLAP